MRTEEGKARARTLVDQRMTAGTLTKVADLARAANGIDPGTVGDFLTGKRWPGRRVRKEIEIALNIEPGTLEMLATEQIKSLGDEEVPSPDPIRDASDEALLDELKRRVARRGERSA